MSHVWRPSRRGQHSHCLSGSAKDEVAYSLPQDPLADAGTPCLTPASDYEGDMEASPLAQWLALSILRHWRHMQHLGFVRHGNACVLPVIALTLPPTPSCVLALPLQLASQHKDDAQPSRSTHFPAPSASKPWRATSWQSHVPHP